MAKPEAPSELKTAKIQLRATEFQKNRIKINATRKKMTMSEWILHSSTKLPESKRIGSRPKD